MEIHFSHVLGIVWISTSPQMFEKPISLGYFFSNIFPVFWEFTFPMFWAMYGFLLLANDVRNTWPWIVLFSHTFPVLSEIISPMFWGQYYWCQWGLKWNLFFDPISTNTFMWNYSLRKLIYIVGGPNPISAFQIPLS